MYEESQDDKSKALSCGCPSASRAEGKGFHLGLWCNQNTRLFLNLEGSVSWHTKGEVCFGSQKVERGTADCWVEAFGFFRAAETNRNAALIWGPNLPASPAGHGEARGSGEDCGRAKTGRLCSFTKLTGSAGVSFLEFSRSIDRLGCAVSLVSSAGN